MPRFWARDVLTTAKSKQKLERGGHGGWVCFLFFNLFPLLLLPSCGLLEGKKWYLNIFVKSYSICVWVYGFAYFHLGSFVLPAFKHILSISFSYTEHIRWYCNFCFVHQIWFLEFMKTVHLYLPPFLPIPLVSLFLHFWNSKPPPVMLSYLFGEFPLAFLEGRSASNNALSSPLRM